MRYRLRVLLIGVAILFATATIHQSHAASPTPTTTPVPVHHSQFTVTYTYHGVPIVTATQPLLMARVNGSRVCDAGGLDEIYDTIMAWPPKWPWKSGAPCDQIGASIQLCDSPQTCSKEFVYTGEDQAIDSPRDDLIPDAPIVIAHFVHEGVPQTVSISSWSYRAGSTNCVAKRGSFPAPHAKVSLLGDIWYVSPMCSAVGTRIDVTFTTDELGDLRSSFVWSGASLDFDVDTGVLLQTATPSPSLSANATLSAQPTSSIAITPVTLPKTGGAASGTNNSSTMALAVVLLLTSLAGFVIARSRKVM
jgi:hypothetical protein